MPLQPDRLGGYNFDLGDGLPPLYGAGPAADQYALLMGAGPQGPAPTAPLPMDQMVAGPGAAPPPAAPARIGQSVTVLPDQAVTAPDPDKIVETHHVTPAEKATAAWRASHRGQPATAADDTVTTTREATDAEKASPAFRASHRLTKDQEKERADYAAYVEADRKAKEDAAKVAKADAAKSFRGAAAAGGQSAQSETDTGPHVVGYQQPGYVPSAMSVEKAGETSPETKQELADARTSEEAAVGAGVVAGQEAAAKNYATRETYNSELNKMNQNQQALVDMQGKELDDHMKYVADLGADAKAQKIDAWHDRSKPLAIIGAMLMGLSNGPAAIKAFNEAAESDVREQQANLNNKRASVGEAQNVFTLARQKFGDQHMAYEVARQGRIQQMMGQLEQDAETYKGTAAGANALKALADMQREDAKSNQKIEQMATTKIAYKYQPGGPIVVGGGPQVAANDDGKFLRLPDGTAMHASNEKQAGEWDTILRARGRVVRSVDLASQLLSSPSYTDAQAVGAAINNAVNSMGPLATGGTRASSLGELEKLGETVHTSTTISADLAGKVRKALKVLRDEAEEAASEVYNSSKDRWEQKLDAKSGKFMYTPSRVEAKHGEVLSDANEVGAAQ